MYNPIMNSIVLRFPDDTEVQMILDLAEVMTIYQSAVLDFLFAMKGAHDNGGAERVGELKDYIWEWVRRQLRIMDVGEP